MDSGPRAPTRPFPKLLAVAKLGPRLGVARAPTDGAAERTPLAAGLGTLVSRVRTRLRATPSEGPRSGWAAIAGLGLVYFVAAKLGLQLAYLHASATAVWAPTGIAVAALLRLGCGVWPGIFLGAFLANVTTAGSVATSIGIGLGNTLEGVVAALLVERFAGSMRTAGRPRDLLLFALLAAGLSTTLSATAGVGTLSLAGYAAWRDFRAIWTTWWLSDAVGCLVVAPALLSWTSALQPRWTRLRALEAAALAAAVALSGGLTFAGVVPQVGFGLQFLCFPVLVWAAFRFGQRETASALLLLSAIAIGGTMQGAGPFARTSPHEALLLLQAFIGVTAVTALVLAAVVTDHRRLEEELRKQAETDPLTGLTNYRQLVRTLDQEVRRALRTGRPFALLLFDLDRLKELNDRHGHQEGSRALQRVAEAMRASCRALDTAARQGGDEFALVLPETDRASALLVSGRIQALLASDPREPRISVSAGVAEFPADGGSSEALIRAADGVLYRAKRSRR